MVEIMKMMFLVPFLFLHAGSVEGYEFRLLSNNSQGTEGFVEILHNDLWGFIGHPKFRFSDATASLLCRKFNLSLFGYGAIDIHQENNTFSYFWLQKLECNGNERSIDECVNTGELNRTQYIDIYPWLPWLPDYSSKLYCVDYRLMGGLSQNTGMLLAAFSGTQHSMCYQGFDSSAGDVVCKHLRYNGLADLTEGDPGTIPLFNNKLTCTGNESSLNECTMSNAVIENCTRAVYITCKAVRLITRNEYNDEGFVEIFYNGSWGFFLSEEKRFDKFNEGTANFLCETFGFRNVGFSLGFHVIEPYEVNGWFGNLSCNGTEADIMQCVEPLRFGPEDTFGILNGPILSFRTWLYCFDFRITSMRLVNGKNPNEGEVQIQIGGRWGSIYMEDERNTSQRKTVGSVVCKILGYVGVSEIWNDEVWEFNKYTWMSIISCNGNEIDLTDCNYSKEGHPFAGLVVKCEDTDQCQSNPCLNNGICVDGDRSYTCTCTERWSGINCEIDTDQCQSNPCLNNGTCVDGDRSYTCNCTERWRGINCEIDTDPCQSNPCLNNGICVDGDRSYTCNCTERWRGINCEIDIDECLYQPCENDGACINAINGFVCFCAEGYEGYRCQNDIDECLNQPCENDGSCINTINGFVCHCDDGYEGYRCQNEVGDQTTLIVVLISLICVLSIVVFATVCCCLRYRRKHKKTKSDASNVLKSGQVGLQNTIEVEAVQKEMEEGQYNEDVYDGIKENTVADHADYIHPVTDVELHRDADGYVKFADNDQSVGYYKLKHTQTEDYSKLPG